MGVEQSQAAASNGAVVNWLGTDDLPRLGKQRDGLVTLSRKSRLISFASLEVWPFVGRNPSSRTRIAISG